MKGQVIIDFLVDYSIDENETFEQNYNGVNPWKLYFDGSCYGKGSSIAMMTMSPQESLTKFMYKLSKKCLSNEAEYESIIVGLESLLD